MKKTIYLSVALFIITAITLNMTGCKEEPAEQPAEQQMYYELKIYRLTDPGKNAIFDSYMKDAFIPAMHRLGIERIGVFKPIEADTAFGKMVYVFVPYADMIQCMNTVTALENDAVYQSAGKAFLDAPYDDPPFTRYESILMKAFSYMPQYRAPSYTNSPGERIYELRSYESWTEEKATKKIKMFNEGGEMEIFEKVGSNAVFYGQVIFGSLKPRLMYMTTYSDMESQQQHWADFREHPDWKVLSADTEYANTVIRPNAYLLHPTDYSDF
ncbi:MAG: NIPSNAP family protein [Bacteroidales bacterium]|nr:NIPSNAP family protein [Bacteroidales bacterium]